MNIENKFGSYVRSKRKDKGFGLREFCRKIYFDPSNFSKIERNKIYPPKDIDDLNRIAYSLELDEKECNRLFYLAEKCRNEMKNRSK